MADENNEDDSWLYGSSAENAENLNDTAQSTDQADGLAEAKDVANESLPPDVSIHNVTDGTLDDGKEESLNMSTDADGLTASTTNGETTEAAATATGNGEGKGGADDDDDDDDDDDSDDSDEDDIVVTIRDIQPASTFNIKQRAAAATGAAPDKPKTNLGKFSIEEFESIGTIAGQTAIEYNVEAIEDKPWRKPGADITDYFNYGFSEETWRSYCERQKRMRHESGTSLSMANSNAQNNSSNNANRTLTSLTSSDNNNKFSSSGGPNSHSGPSNYGRNSFGSSNDTPVKENVIQVMTAERREYSRAKGKFDVTMSMPPPAFNMAGNEPFFPDDNFSYGYEPTQEQQWNNDSGVGWMPSGIKELTPGPQQMMGPPPPHMNMNMGMNMPPPPNPMMPPNMMNPAMPPQMVPPPQHNMNLMPVPPPNPMPMMPPPNLHTPPQMPPNAPNRSEDHRGNPNEYREHDDKRGPPPAAWRRDKERDYREREMPLSRPAEESPAERERRRDRERYRDRERDRDRTDRGTSRRERSRSRERSERRRRSKSRDRKSRDQKKKSHKKDKEDSD